MNDKIYPRHGNLGPVACAIVEALKDGRPGDKMSDARLEELCGRDCRVGASGYPALQSAIRYLIRVHRLHWKRVPRQGLRCYSSLETAADAQNDVRLVRRHCTRTVHKTLAVRIDDVPEAQRPAFNATVAQVGAIAAIAMSETRKRLETAKRPALDYKQLVQAAIENGS